MDYITIGKHYDAGKIAYVKCIEGDILENPEIKNKAFLMIFLKRGKLNFTVNSKDYTANAPCFICFDESHNPAFTNQNHTNCFSIYFHPMYLNVNMSFSLIRSDFYGDIAHNHDLFLLKPFTENNYIVPISTEYTEMIDGLCHDMKYELEEQNDWYWSCRGRSYFMEIILMLERLYSINSKINVNDIRPSSFAIENKKLKNAVAYIENHYQEQISLADIQKNSGLNHTNLTHLMKTETGYTAMEYLMKYRIAAAEKKLRFTALSIKEISARCGFKTVQHFTRAFKNHTGKTPALFRIEAVEKRKSELSR